MNLESFQEIGQTAPWKVVRLLAWPALIGLTGVVSLLVMQGGWVWRPERLTPDLARLDPSRGVQRATADVGRHLLFVPAKYLVGLTVALAPFGSRANKPLRSPATTSSLPSGGVGITCSAFYSRCCSAW